MKLLYVYTTRLLKTSSVQNKVLSQIKHLNLVGVKCTGAFFTTEVKEITKMNELADFIPVEKSFWKYFINIGQRKNLDMAIEKHLTEVYNEYDIIYFRYPGATRKFSAITKKFGNKIVIENQAKEIPEMISLVKNERFKFKLGYLFYFYEFGIYTILQEYFFGKRVLKRIKGGIAVTKEVADYEKSRVPSFNTHVVGNGIEFENYKVADEANFNGLDINFFVLIGANTSSPTHGVDRLIRSVKNNSSKYFIHLHIFSKSNYESVIGENYEIKYEGYLSNEELTRKLINMHFAIGGLASFRKSILFGSALKVREYFARGFPIIMASKDEDIENSEIAKQFVIQVPNVEDNIDFKVLENKIDLILNKTGRSKLIREEGERLFSFNAKMKILKEKLEILNK